MKGYLIAGCPFVVGITVYSSFETNYVTKTGIVPMPPVNRQDYILGGHCVLVCGFNDNFLIGPGKSIGVWIVRNSWGINWGDHDYFYLPYAYLLTANLCSDNWCIEG